RFGAEPRVAYNFDSFGHGGGLPQVLRQAGYEMYIHMRPQAGELALPADLYRWRGVDGTTIPAYRIAVGLYHTEHDNIETRLREGVELAPKLGRDVTVFWGLGNHGGGATRRDLAAIEAFAASKTRVRIVHSTPDAFYEAVKEAAAVAPIHEGDLQRVFTGCYTSLSRLKRQAVSGLGRLVQAEAVATAASWLAGAEFPEADLRQAWKLHMFNDFHDILTGTCVEPAERDALAQYGRAEDIGRSVALAAAAALNRGRHKSPPLPVTVVNANPALGRVPVELECMADHRPFWKGLWRMRLFRADGREVPCQEEQPESLLPFNNWRRRISFIDDLPGVGAARYELRAFEIATGRGHVPKVRVPVSSPLSHRIDPKTGLVASLKPFRSRRSFAGPLFEPLVVMDTADSWGTGQGGYRKIVGRFKPCGRPTVIERGPIRAITRSILAYRGSRIVMDTVSYPTWPVLEFRFRVTWNEEQRRLKLRLPTALDASTLLAEVPAGAIERPADGQEHVHGRWLVVEGRSAGRAAAVGVASSGQHGLDFQDGEVRLSVLRSSAYCHERGFDLGTQTSETCPPGWKFADIGVHEFKLLVTAGAPAAVKSMMPGLADYLAAPPAAYAHLPYMTGPEPVRESLLSLKPANIRMLACKKSWDGRALIVRLHEAIGKKTRANLAVGVDPGHGPEVRIPLSFAPFEIKTLRIEKDGSWRGVGPQESSYFSVI
ncbi:MAG TPA: glycoside hydrolase family 38 C-terminal domain-containing protein, partial [Candidatus Bathyarchaeia archaeon]|nr:glycoside hydrolase family 38 C-terminal domain-containing protein [Candidatus Bathyarchaeia archaeon]